METLKFPEAIPTQKITAAETATQVEPAVESFVSKFTDQKDLASKFAGSGDPVGNGATDGSYSEKRHKELERVYLGLPLLTLKRIAGLD